LSPRRSKLGLKLESTKGPVEVVVIDAIEKPTEDQGGQDVSRPSRLAITV